MMDKLNNTKFFRGDVILSNQDIGKKAVEENDLEPFLKEYERITNFSLKIIERTERPDFIVQRSDGTQLGIELTKVMRDPESTFWARVLNGEEQADPIDTVIRLQELINLKGIKLLSLTGNYRNVQSYCFN